MTIPEMLRLQGIPPHNMFGWFLFTSKSRMGHAIGNSMSVNVLQRIIPRALQAAGMLGDWKDPWETKGYRPF